jgi:DEAD/DEAH box helicase domain-containing protein
MAGSFSWGSLDLLSRVLRDPDLSNAYLVNRALLRSLTTLMPHKARDEKFLTLFKVRVAEVAPDVIASRFTADDPGQVLGGFSAVTGSENPNYDFLVALPMSSMRGATLDSLAKATVTHLCLDDRQSELSDEFKANWRTFWHAANQLQFLPQFSLATRRLVDSGLASQIWTLSDSVGVDDSDSKIDVGQLTDAAWTDVYEFSSLDVDILKSIMESGIRAPDVGIDLSNDDGEIILSGDVLELCWRVEKVIVTNEVVVGDIAGWTIVVADDMLLANLSALRDKGVI